MLRSKPSALAVLALLASAACTDSDQPITAPDSAGEPRRAGAGEQRRPTTSDDELARAARAEAPGLAGFYLQADGTPVILLKDAAQRGAAERYLARQLARARRGRHAGAPERPVFRSAVYDFAELKGWFDSLEGLLAREDVYTLDVDEVGNRVLVGVRDEQAIRNVREEAARAGVPAAALHVRTERAPAKRQTVRDWTATLAGGYQISFAKGDCTLGFNAVYNGVWIFVTNSHCTWVEQADDGSTITQPTYYAGNEIGWEIRDRGRYACNGLFTSCRRADAAYIQHNYSRGVSQGGIVYTPLGSGGPGGLTVSGEYDVVRRYAGTAPVGTWLDKTGRTSGSTFGQVTQSCVAIDEFRCQDISNIWSEHGDSGSPVYVWLGNNQVELYGILWGGPDGDWNTTWSSRLAGIEQDLGPLSALCRPGYGC